MALEYPHYVYALIEREHIISGNNIVKIGRTSKGLRRRMGQYPNGSIMFASFPIRPLDIQLVEKLVLAMAKASFRATPFYGAEYFQGNITAIRKMMGEVIDGYEPNQEDMIDAMDNATPQIRPNNVVDHNGDDSNVDHNVDHPINIDESLDCIMIDTNLTQSNPIEENTVVVEEEVVNPLQNANIDDRIDAFMQANYIQLEGCTKSYTEFIQMYQTWLNIHSVKSINQQRVRSILIKTFAVTIVPSITGMQLTFPRQPRQPTRQDENTVEPIVVNHLHNFLSMSDDERGYAITYVKGHITMLDKFKSVFDEYSKGSKLSSYFDTFQQFNFTVSTQYHHVCKNCNSLARGRGENRCCDKYNRKDRIKKMIIYDMKMVPLT
jgi:hypothetical protein